ncbi:MULTISPECIES: FAD-binding oxidoreductase [unclassified Rhizobium]|uniref:NAD(P)/FAD-dependent oxidoreductase n=1 Tax=unclassified Rhizobium TaxID=2613769 RepID=UPI001C828546|nr:MULTISPECIES: FAD-binding oxidoreductase [unclassified Rhizobium]MBX5167615.1 FAD-binding oxidoreductase [Rhizobium sp. NZLR4b]MBX5173147.1 FAD-binding oxidoreductase [Rhizobium sp. NZLR1b]MBX5186185.1 FAD-binding oxidoreductase [Rhizobium sp. NZLR5]MBX5191851.1 FAD-binding oxidoreductase [Rhizobium sp. NZLR3b]MBX5199397.1 FAD-binding oxidoreductase [Rhizobium sp. NZLR10]
MSSIVVVGAGIIGATIAYELQRRGNNVTLLDKAAPGRGASYGNMASIAVTEFMPASRPGIWAQMPKWLLDPEGPVRIRPGYLPKLVPWFLMFLAASRPSKLRELEAAGAVLCRRVHEDLDVLLKETGLTHMLTAEGCLSLYADEAEFQTDREHIDILERFGFRHEILGGNAIRDLEPALTTTIGKAVLFPDNRSITDPYKLVTALTEKFQALGGRIVQGDVVDFEQNEAGVSAVRLADGQIFAANAVVLAAGAFTARLSALLREHIPLETERGYHTQIMEPGISMRHSIIWPARAFMVTPTAGGIRVGGTVEMAGLDAPPDYRRAKILVKRAQEALPELKAVETTEWMGHRPALPDTVPVMGPSAKRRNVWYATGHGHLGLTYAATTGRLMADLVTGAQPPVDMRPYRIDRF